MNETSRHDAWNAGDSYDAYMGRWSRQIAAKFLDWLDMEKKLDWLEVGCGTGEVQLAEDRHSLLCCERLLWAHWSHSCESQELVLTARSRHSVTTL